MPLYYIVLLALIQGITEFLPISSSGHLVIVHEFLGEYSFQEELIIDVAVHVGTLFSALIFFHKEVLAMIRGFFGFFTKTSDEQGQKLFLAVLVGSIPVVIAGFILYKLQASWLRDLHIMGWALILFGILLWYADRFKPAERTLASLGLKDALVIGLSQALSLIPGTSRSGITMTTARWLGFSRTESARYSLLLAIVAISGAGTLGAYDLYKLGDVALGMDALLAAFLAFLSGLAAIYLMMKWLSHASFTPFVIYRIALGVLLLGLLYSGMIS